MPLEASYKIADLPILEGFTTLILMKALRDFRAFVVQRARLT
jgi:hypothetical protein